MMFAHVLFFHNLFLSLPLLMNNYVFDVNYLRGTPVPATFKVTQSMLST